MSTFFIFDTEELQDQDLGGRDHWGAQSSTGTPPKTKCQLLPSAQSVSETPGSGAPWSGRVGGGQTGISWIPSETGVQ